MDLQDDEDIDPIDLTPLISGHITPIVTVPTTDEDKAEDSSIPGLETDKLSSDEAKLSHQDLPLM